MDAFRRFDVAYMRLLNRIPTGNAARDSPAVQAMRYIQAVMKNRPDVGRLITQHLRSGGVDENNPSAVRDALTQFLEDTASIARLCSGPHAALAVQPADPAPRALAPSPATPDLVARVEALQLQVDRLLASPPHPERSLAARPPNDAHALDKIHTTLATLASAPALPHTQAPSPA